MCSLLNNGSWTHSSNWLALVPADTRLRNRLEARLIEIGGSSNANIEVAVSRRKLARRACAAIAVAATALTMIFILPNAAVLLRAQTSGPTMTVPNLAVRTAVDGLVTPIGLAFLSDSEWFVIEKNTGNVKVVEDGAVTGTALDLAVNNFSERGLLGIALHPDFEENNFVYLFWSCVAPPPPAENEFFPTANECALTPGLGADSDHALAVPLLGNRVDRFVWNGATRRSPSTSNLIMLRSFQNDASTSPTGRTARSAAARQPRRRRDSLWTGREALRSFGDVGRRGQLQNLPSGPTLTGLGDIIADDQFGGPGRTTRTSRA